MEDCIFSDTYIRFNNQLVTLNVLHQYVCNIDDRSSTKTIRRRVEQGLKANRLSYSPDEIREMFWIDKERFERPIKEVGNAFLCCNAAIGFANNKKIYCFPWMSKLKMEYYSERIKYVCATLSKLDCIVLLPVSNPIPGFEKYQVLCFPFKA